MTNLDQGEITPGLSVGSLIADKYRVEKRLGAGGMGVVVRAMHVELREPVAIKILLPEVSHHPEAAARFLREARAAARLRSPHVARSSDVGTLASGQKYMVMEYLQGSDLAAILTQRGALPIQQAIEYVLQACDAVSEAHQMGIIHRDLKPANLFLVRQPDGTNLVKVLDFGISKAVDLHSSRNTHLVTRSQSMIGTPVYASPEQLMSAADVDERTDIWALGGVVLYELLAGTPPFAGNSIEELVAHVVASEPAPLRSIRPDVSPALERIVSACLQKDRKHRFASVPDLAEALSAVTGSELDDESRVLVSRIMRRQRPSSVPPTDEHGPTQFASGQGRGSNFPSAASVPVRRPSAPAEDTRVSATERPATRHSHSTNAGLYSSRPVIAGEPRRRAGLMWLTGLLAIGILGLAAVASMRWHKSGSSPSSGRGMEAAQAVTTLGAAVSQVPPTSSVTVDLVSVASAAPSAPSAHTRLDVPVSNAIPKALAVAPSVPTPRIGTPLASAASSSPIAADTSLPVVDRHGFVPSRLPPSTKVVTDFGPRR